MKRVCYMVLIALFAISGRATAAAEEPQGALIELSTKLIELGELSTDDDKVLFRLTFRNVGDVPLVITDVRTSCSCTTVQYERRKVMPNEQGAMTVTFDPAKAPEGALYRILQIFSTSTSGVEHVTLTANIVK